PIWPRELGVRDAAFRLLAADGWPVAASDQELAISWVVQHPEMESFVAHDAAAFSRVFAMITMSHRPQLRPVRHGDHRENTRESRRVVCDKALHFRMLDHPGDGQFLVTRGDRPAIGGEQPERGVPDAELARPDR